jgi:uncharacterized phage infection (PIP) family protein YhgE
MNPADYSAHFEADTSAVVVEHLAIRDRDVVLEAHRWTRGERGPAVEDIDELVRANLTNYVTEALRIGAHALSVTGQAQESRAVEKMLKDVSAKTVETTDKAAEATSQAVRDATDTVTRAANDAKKAITEIDERSRKEFTAAVGAAKEDLNTEVRRIFGGENPELVDRLRPLLDKFSSELDTKVSAGTSDLLAKAAKQFDPTDPTSPMAKHAAELAFRQEQLTQQLDKNHNELADKVAELSAALRDREKRTTLAKVTPLKGDTYARQIHTLMFDIAGGLGDEYSDTSAVAGRLPHCKKGDGLLTVDAGSVRVIVEATDSARGRWGDYFDEAERNRDAVAALGLVRTAAQNGGHTIRVIGTRRVVLAFDPDQDDADLLRTVVLLLRATAITASARKGANQIATAQENITEAVAQLAKIDSIKKLANTIQKGATKIDSECIGLNSSIRRLLDQALAALDGSEAAAEVDNPADGVQGVA